MATRSLLDLSVGDNLVIECADWVEMATLFKDDKTISQGDLARQLQKANIVAKAKADEVAIETFDELNNRATALASFTRTASYPFELVGGGKVLRLARRPSVKTNAGLVYLFLLTITRASMDSRHRKLASLDPTNVFEHLCAGALLSFWGGLKPQRDVFLMGTSRTAGTHKFPALVTQLCKGLGEGQGWKPTAKSPRAGDGGLDVAVWTRFEDGRSGGLVAFAQCKTGDNWREHLGRKGPASFVHAYLSRPLVLDPLHIFMVPCRVEEGNWEYYTRQAKGLLFDRCRITSFSGSIARPVLLNCKNWLEAAINLERKGSGPKRPLIKAWKGKP